jgi:succinate dehydrogenase / fumarate reductase cytochrome b subunit
VSTAESNQPSVFALMKKFGESSVGAKVIMATTGVVVWGFVIGHLVGNLQIFLPGDYDGQALNHYAHALKTTAPLLWGTRIVVGVSLLVHIATGMRLAKMNMDARPVGYKLAQQKKASIASKLMPFSGLIVLGFIVVHLLHYTLPFAWADLLELRDAEGNHDVYGMVVQGFSSPWMVCFYIVGQLCLFSHLLHGSTSFMQSLGIRHTRWTPFLNKGALTLVAFILAGNLLIPSYIFLTHGISSH